MQYNDLHGNPIRNLDDWRTLVFGGAEKQKHWKPGRSAYSIADFMMNKNGEAYIQKLVAALLKEDVQLDEAIPELEVKFDDYGHGREHDLGIRGKTKSGKSIFIGVESKVDESFNKTTGEVYLAAKAKELSGVKTNAACRVEDLTKLIFSQVVPFGFDLRYQLLYATAGTALKEKAEIKILLIMVFKTSLYDAAKGKRNHEDYLKFLESANATPVNIGVPVDSHLLTLKNGEKVYPVYTIYATIP